MYIIFMIIVSVYTTPLLSVDELCWLLSARFCCFTVKLSLAVVNYHFLIECMQC